MIYDGDCGFCRRWIARWKSFTEDRIDYASSQEVTGRFPQIPQEQFAASVQLIEPDGKIFSGAEAVFRALAVVPGKRWSLWCYHHLPGFASVSEWFYRLVARHRIFFSHLTRFFWGKEVEPSSYFIARWIFLRLLGLIYLAAFVSLGVQVMGLAGSHGIMPAENFLKSVSEQVGSDGYWMLPTLCWFNAGDAFLKFLCWGGTGLSLILIFDFSPPIILFFLWLFYLSVSVACQDFLWFQWDILLLETGFLAIFLAPWRILPSWSRQARSCSLALWLLWWLLFRLMFESGCVKLLSHDPSWKSLTALQFHYETQPLPTWIGWYAHQLPVWFQKISCVAMFGIELAVPFLIFLPRRLRIFAAFSIILLQTSILLTGNYCFFNWLTIGLSILLLDDAFLKWILPRRLSEKIELPSVRIGEIFLKRILVWFVAAIFIVIGGIQVIGMFKRIPRPLAEMVMRLSSFRTINSYGLFAVMTTERPEIIVEGSNDGKEWLPYEFKWKPGDLNRRPKFIAPHQPRLDWQMWFAALSDYRSNPWFINFLSRLLMGESEVTSLLEKNPFPQSPPKYIRAVLYDYHFTDAETRKKDGSWWTRTLKGLYCPVVSLRNRER